MEDVNNIHNGYAYFSLSFMYHSLRERESVRPTNRLSRSGNVMVHLNFGDVTEDMSASRLCFMADREVERLLTSMKLDFKHAYSWPDGSCYKDVRVPVETLFADAAMLRRGLNSGFVRREQHYRRLRTQIHVRVQSVYPANATEIPRWCMLALHECWDLTREEQDAKKQLRREQEDARLDALLLENGGNRHDAVDKLYASPVLE